MKLFGYVLVREDEYDELRSAYARMQNVFECMNWFSGWSDLKIIWTYINCGAGPIWNVREAYALARGTDRDGNKINEWRVRKDDSRSFVTECCDFRFIGRNHSPEMDGTCRHCGSSYSDKEIK